MNPGPSVSNISEWCKKEACWDRLQRKLDELMELLPVRFFEELISVEDVEDAVRSAVETQKITNGIEAQTTVLEISGHVWAEILAQGQAIQLYSPKEIGILQIASQLDFAHNLPMVFP